MKTKRTHSMARILFSSFICGMIVFWGFQVFGEDLSAAQEEVWKMEEKYWSTWKKEGVKSIQAFHSKEAVIGASNAAFPPDRTNLRSYFDGIGDMVDSFELELHKIGRIGIVAVAQYYAKVISLGRPITFRISHTWMKQDGEWVIIGATHGSCSELPNCL